MEFFRATDARFLSWNMWRRCGITFLFCLAVWLFICANVTNCFSQELDIANHVRVPGQAPLVWDNVLPDRQWLRGVEPVRKKREKLHSVLLQPGQWTEFLVPANQLVRAVTLDRSVSDGIEIWTSNGSGMYRHVTSAISSDRRSVIAAPGEADFSTARVQLSSKCNSPRLVGLFTSRRQEPQRLDYYQCRLTGQWSCVSIKDNIASRKTKYWRVGSELPTAFQLSKPTRIRIEARLDFDSYTRREETFWLHVKVNGELVRILTFDTLPVKKSRTFVDDCERLVGIREFAYLDIGEESSDVTIESSHPAFVRVDAIGLKWCKRKLNESLFELPIRSDSRQLEEFWKRANCDAWVAGMSGELKQARPRRNGAAACLLDPYLSHQLIRQLARDNRVKRAGLRAYMWMRASSAMHHGDADFRGETSVAELTSRLRTSYTFFRDQLPLSLSPDNEMRVVDYRQRRLRNSKNKATEVIVGEQHIADSLKTIKRATLFKTSGDHDPLYFRPAEDLGPSYLRIVVDQTHLEKPCKVFVQYDHCKPVELGVDCGDSSRRACMIPERDEATLAAMSLSYGEYDHGVMGGPYSQFKVPHPVVEAGTCEMLLPAGVEEVRVWVGKDHAYPVYLGVQTLDVRPYQLSERAHRYLREQNVVALDPVVRKFVEDELDNDRHPLKQFVESKITTFSAGVESSVQTNEPTEIWDEQVLQSLMQLADTKVKNQRWASAIEMLSDIIAHSSGATRQTAVLSRIFALLGAQEYFLANLECRGWFLNSQDQVFKDHLLAILSEQADRVNDERLKEAYACMGTTYAHRPGNAIRFAEQLADHGRFRFALLTLPSLESQPETEDLILRCCFQVRWWQLFDETLLCVNDPGKKFFWAGLKSYRLGQYRQARDYLQQAGPSGIQWLQHCDQGHQLHERLQSGDQLARLDAIADWKKWQADNPSPVQWVADPTVVKESCGAATVYALVADTTAQYFLSQPERPATISIEGPCRIKIEGRPLHTESTESPLQDWMTIRNSVHLEVLPVVNNYPSTLLQIRGVPGKQAGGLVQGEIQIPAGRNTFQIGCKKSPLLFRVLVSQPENQLPMLPAVNEFTLNAIRDGALAEHCNALEASPGLLKDCVRMVCRDATCCSVACDYRTDQLCSGLYGRFGDSGIHSEAKSFEITSLDKPMKEAVLAYLLTEPEEEGSRVNAMSGLIQISKLVQENTGRSDVKRLLGRLKQGFTWEQYRQFDSRAGIRSFNFAGWRPESPAVRVRKALTGEWNWDYALLDANNLDIRINQGEASALQFDMQRPRVSFMPVKTTNVEIDGQLNSWTAKFELPEQIVNLESPLSPGLQQFSLRQSSPTVNHFVGVNVYEKLSNGTRIRIADDSNNVSKRVYHVATQSEPLTFRYPGPGIIRIDEVDESLNFIDSQTVLVESENQKFDVYPGEGREYGYFRIFEMVDKTKPIDIHHVDPVPKKTEYDWADDFAEQVVAQVGYFSAATPSEALSLRSPAARPVELSLNDFGDLGLQELGTWLFDVGYRNRRSIEEQPIPVAAGRFLDIKVGRYFYNPWTNRYSFHRALVRPRIGDGTTFGWLSRGSMPLPIAKCRDCRANGWGPYQLSWSGYGFIQNAGTPLESGANSAPWIFGGSVRLSRNHRINDYWSHRPTWTAFGRVLSEDDGSAFEPGVLDQDVFTRYKRNHRYGLRYSNRFTYQRCLDRRSWFSPYIVTNEDQLEPDNLGIQFGTDQLIGPLELQLAYRLTNFIADNDRVESSLQNVVSLDAVLDRWHTKWRRSEIRFSVQHDLDDEGTSFSFNLVNYFNHGRGYRDFRDADVLFKSVKEHRAARHYDSLGN